MTWQRVAILFILVSGSLVAGALGMRELAFMLAGAAGGGVVPAQNGHDKKKEIP